jgi:RimJ/RimL family protein N-acetyltransferase
MLLERTESLHEPHIPVLETGRLVLRAPRLDDAERVAALVNDRRIAENTARIPHPYALADAESWIGASNRTAGEATFVIETGGEVIGGCGFDLREAGQEIGYWIGVPFWGNGYATEAAQAVIDYAFGELRLEALLSGARITNPASRRVLEKCGFQWTGVGLCRIRALGTSVPLDRFRLERAVWALRRKRMGGAARREGAARRDVIGKMPLCLGHTTNA